MNCWAVPSFTDSVVGEMPALTGPVMTKVTEVPVQLEILLGLLKTCAVTDGTLDEAGGNLCGSVDGWGCRSVVGGAALSVARPRSKTACRSTRCVHDVAVYVEQRDVGRVSRSCSEYLGPIDWNRRYLWGDGDGNVLVAVMSTAACERKGGESDKNDAGRAKVHLETLRTSDFNGLQRITRFVTVATKISSLVCRVAIR